MIAWSGIVATLALTALAFLPLPTGAGQRLFSNLVVIPWHNTHTAIAQQRLPSHASRAATDNAGSWATLDASTFLQLLSSLRGSESAVARYHSTARLALVVFAIGLTIGLLRLIHGLWAIAGLRLRSTAVADGRVTQVLAELLPRLPLLQCPHLRETRDLDSAAVIGWWQPTLMLPAVWREWSPSELKAVLAHELAHIARHDAPWRLVAAFLVALHWGQPLMHWLRRHLLLAQELAADELASAAIGSRPEYLQSLANLALRHDNRRMEMPPAALLPVFSGFLLRRIAMLRAKDGSLHRNWRLLTQGTALTLVAAVTLFATAIRGLADPPETQSDGSIRVAIANDPKPIPTEAALFQRPPFDLAKLAFGKQGGFLVRLGEILNQPRFAEAAREHDELLAKYWKDAFPGAEAPPYSLKDINYIAGDFTLWARYVPPPEGEQNPHPRQVLFGSQCGTIHFRRPVQEIFAWLKRTPSAEVKQHGDFPYVALPIAFMGPAPICICPVDDHTLLWAGGEGVLQKRLEKLGLESDPPQWHSAWKKVEGGLLTAVAAEAEYKGPPEVVDEADELTRDFFAKTRLKAIGADWQPNAGGNTTFKLQFGFDNEADARSIEAELRRALQMIIQDTRDDASKAALEKGKALAIAKIAMLEQARLETRRTESGWEIDLQLSGPIDIESNL
jgi:beta-lactamase regulating signal transducer with metallopeptidase domain